MKFGSLFAGIGGLDLGLERAGMRCEWQVEIDKYARRVLAKHWPNVQRWDDIKTFCADSNIKRQQVEQELNGKKKAREQIQQRDNIDRFRVDLICGGFPCQDISYAGTGAGLEGERSGLFYEAIRIIRTLGPKYVLLENVSALLTRGLGDVVGTLAEIGYDCEWHCVQAADVGAPHLRDRVFIIGKRSNSRCELLERRESPRSIDRSQLRSNSQWWSTEPTVGRVANGIPRPLDIGRIVDYIGLHGSKNQINVAETSTTQGRDGQMRILRLYLELTTTSPELGHAGSCPGSLPIVPRESGLGKRPVGNGQKEETPMRDLSELVSAEMLPCDQDVRERMPVDPREVQRWLAVGKRADRLRGLGNAVVPQVAEFFGKMIMQIEEVTR